MKRFGNYSQLVEVAAQCPESGGRGVFIARSVLNGLGYNYSYNDEALCYPAMRLSNVNTPKSQPLDTKIKCVPNPNAGSFVVYSQAPDISTCTIMISDVVGSNVDFRLEKSGINSVSLTLNKPVPGIYLVRVFDSVSGELQVAEPLIIISE